jgi:hypothetical protein
MHDTAKAADAVAADSQVHIYRKTFDRIEGLKKRVAETTVLLDRAAREHKEAKSAHDTAQTNLAGAVSDMLDEVNGVSKLPLFDNQTDAIAKAEADPIAQKLLTRMLDHGITGLNVLVVHGYDEAQRNQLAAYLDAMDERKAAEAAGTPLLTDAPELPAFLAIADGAQTIDQDAADDLQVRLNDEGLALGIDVLSRLNVTQHAEVLTWLRACDDVKREKGEVLTVDDLPNPPSYLTNPAELLPAEDVATEEDAPKELTTELDEPAKPKAKTPRRSSAKFTNKPRVVKAKAKKKGRK